MTAITETTALAVAAAGLVCLTLAVVVDRAWREGLRMALDLWVAAGLLRLTGDPGLVQIGGAAAVVGIRQLVSAALRHGAVAARGDARRRPD